MPTAALHSARGGPRVMRAARPRIAALASACLLAAALAGGCGSDADADGVAGALPTGPDDAQAYTEAFLARNPRALLQPELLAVVDLEPTSATAGDTCAADDGVDCLPYAFATDTLLTLSTDDAPAELDAMVLRDRGGAVFLTQTAGSEPTSALVPAGEYVLELRHVFAGDGDAVSPIIFLRPSQPDAAASAAGLVHGMQLSASKDCVGCNFAKAKLANQHFDGLTLTRAVFDGAEVLNTTFRGASMEGCSLRELTSALLGPVGKDRFDADFSGATMTGAHFSFLVYAGHGGFAGIFRGAQLDDTVWELERGDDILCVGQSFNAFCALLNPDFRNASLRNSRFPRVRIRNGGDFPYRCTFQGADLTGADFRTAAPRSGGLELYHCRFDREPESGRITVLHSANLSGVNAAGVLGRAGANFRDADLSGAILEGADFSLIGNGSRGAILAHANLSGARIAGARWAGADLTGATLTGIIPATFNGVDLRFTVFADVDLAGIDLSRADLSQCASFLTGAPRLTGATLTNGTTGVNLSRQVFPSLYSGLKGADLTGATLTGVELREADLEGVTLDKASLVGANLNFANLRRARLIGATLGAAPGSEVEAASLRGALMTDVDLTDADLRSVDLGGAHLYGDTQQTKLIRTRLDSANFAQAICSGAHFSGSLNNAVFAGAQLVNSVFNGATLTNAKFDDAYLQGADFANAAGVTGTALSNAAIAAAPGFWPFTEQDGTPFTLRYEATKLGKLATDGSVRCPNGERGPCCPSGDLTQCLTEKLKPVRNGPFPPIPACVPKAPRFDNCITPKATATPRPTPTPVRR